MATMTHAAPPRAPNALDPRRWLGLAVIGTGMSLIVVDATIVNVAIPTIIHSLRLTFGDAEWVNSIYALVFAALLVTFGRLGDRAGRKRLFMTGLVVFLTASALAGAAPTGGLLIGARLLQGIGAAMILPATLSLINATFQGRERAIAFAVWGALIGGMAALGPLLGGWLTTRVSWRWAFLVNLPIGLLVLLGALAWVRESRDEQAQSGSDLPGVLTLTLGMAALVFALIEGQNYGWWTPARPFTLGTWTWPLTTLSVIPAAFGVALASLTACLLVERRRGRVGRATVIDLHLFRLKSYAYGNATALVVSLGEMGLVFVLPLFLQGVLGDSAFQTGLVLLALAGGAFAASAVAAALSQRLGPRRVVTLGMGLEAAGLGSLTALLSATTANWTLVPALFVYGIGVGLASAQLTGVVLSEVPPSRSGQAAGMQSTVRQVGSALGIALIGMVLAVTLNHETAARLARIPGLVPHEQARLVTTVTQTAGQAVTALAGQPHAAPVVAAVRAALAQATRWSALVAAIFVLGGFALSWLLPEARTAERQNHVTVEREISYPSHQQAV